MAEARKPADAAPPLAWAWGDPQQRTLWKRYWIDDVVYGVIAILLYYGLKPIPLPAKSATGGWAGRKLGPQRGPAWDRRARENLARLRPDLDPDVAIRAMWDNIGRSMIETSSSAKLWSGHNCRIVGEDNLLGPKRAGRPRILLLLHIGNWELPGPMVITLGDDGRQFYQPPRNRFEAFLASRSRYTLRHKLLKTDAADTVRGMRFLAQATGVVTLTPDPFVNGRVEAPLFGRALRTDGNLGFTARMAIKTNAVLIPAYALRVGGPHFEIHYETPIEPATEGTAEEKLTETALRINAAIEPIVLKHLDQWLMLHDLRFDRD